MSLGNHCGELSCDSEKEDSLLVMEGSQGHYLRLEGEKQHVCKLEGRIM